MLCSTTSGACITGATPDGAKKSGASVSAHRHRKERSRQPHTSRYTPAHTFTRVGLHAYALIAQ